MPDLKRSGLALPVLFSVAVFTSATLLFLVQPMIAKMMLPLFGGAAAVWNTCLVFYQAVLLLGYLYAHGVAGRLSLKAQLTVHVTLLAAVMLLLPMGIGVESAPAGDASPVPAVLGLLMLTVGLPFFVLAGTGTLLQAWFARTGHSAARDPYFLYAASNVGSMLGLLAYPLLLEPSLGLDGQSQMWTVLYGTAVLLAGLCGFAALRSGDDASTPHQHAPELGADAGTVTGQQRALWVLWAFVPASLMMGVTLYVTTDIAPVPLLWVVPLALYLLGFIVAFARLPALVMKIAGWLMAPALLLLIYFLLSEVRYPMWAALSLHLGAFFLVAVVFHGKLAATRPSPVHLTEFYLWLSVGGVAGGIFNALLAPVMFDTVTEYPLVVILAIILARVVRGELIKRPSYINIAIDVAVTVGFCATTWWLLRNWVLGDYELLEHWGEAWEGWAAKIGVESQMPRWRMTTIVTYAIPALMVAILFFGRRHIAFTLCVLSFLVITHKDNEAARQVIYRDRTFYAALAVELSDDGECRYLMNGTTPHGRQFVDPDFQHVPLSFYHNSGPVGDLFMELADEREPAQFAVVGLGTGSLSMYSVAGQKVTFYELNPGVLKIARDPSLFTYLKIAKGDVHVELGDARLRLEEADDGIYGTILVDAFASDAIPVHLLTREALALYFEKLVPDGILAIHISNRYLDLAPVVARIAEEDGYVARIQDWFGEDGCSTFSTEWVIFAREEDHLGALVDSEYWNSIDIPAGTPLWTDNFSDLWGVLELENAW